MYNSGGFRLVVRRGPQPNQVFELTQDIITLGRDITNEITINDPEISRHHCRLTRGTNDYTIEDHGSTNGTFVNGQRLTGAQPLRAGDLIGLGETVNLVYETSAAAQPAAPPPAFGAAQPPGYGSPEYAAPTGGMPPAAPAGDFYNQQQQQQPQPYQDFGQAPAYPGGFPQAPPAYSYEDDAAARGNRGCGLLIGCGIVMALAAIMMVVGVIVIDSPLDDMPLLSDIAGAAGLPGSSVDNAENYLRAMGECDIEKAQQYVCSRDASFVNEGICINNLEDYSCEKDGNDVTCETTIGGTTETVTLNIRNGQVCGSVFFLSDGR